jgi:threonine dehydrogenase-like Zn-dependent dehydrogenase
MKMAIIGSGPLALLAARHFDHLGAHVTLFQRGPLGGSLNFVRKKFPEFDINFNGKNLKAEEFFQNELVPLVQELEEREIPKVGDVLRVHKRFLHPQESIEGRTRLYDLFRVISSTNPQETILKQVAENPEFFKQLGDEVINSLHKPVESFEDFDLVIEASGFGKKPQSIGAGGAHALNENNLKFSRN